MEKKSPDEAIGVKKEGFMWYYSLPFVSVNRNYLWYLLSVMYRVGLALRGGC